MWMRERPFENLCVFFQYANQLTVICATQTEIRLPTDRRRYDEAAAKDAQPKREDYDTDIEYALAMVVWITAVMLCKNIGTASRATVKEYIMRLNPGEYPSSAEVPESVVDELLETMEELFIKKVPSYTADISYTILASDEVETRQLPGSLFFYTGDDFETQTLTPEPGTEQNRTWFAQTGLIGLSMPTGKRVREVAVRIKRNKTDTMRIALAYDDGNRWETAAVSTDEGFSTVRARLTPATLCEAFRVRLEGTGTCVIYGLDLIMEDGGDGVY
jgi:hypothetical protein